MSAAEATELEVLERGECLQLLAQLEVGRIAVAHAGAPPVVVPVNYVLDGNSIVFRTGPGSKLLALRGAPASFEVDSIDPIRRIGWSVLVQGAAFQVAPDEVHHLRVVPWPGGDKRHYIRIVPASITGRRLSLPEAVADARGYL